MPPPIAVRTLDEYEAIQEFLEARDKKREEEAKKKKAKAAPTFSLPALVLVFFVSTFICGPIVASWYATTLISVQKSMKDITNP